MNIVSSHRKNSCQIKLAHALYYDYARDFIFRGSCFCEKYSYCFMSTYYKQSNVYCIVGVAKNFQFTCTFFWSIPTYSRTLARSFSEK